MVYLYHACLEYVHLDKETLEYFEFEQVHIHVIDMGMLLEDVVEYQYAYLFLFERFVENMGLYFENSLWLYP